MISILKHVLVLVGSLISVKLCSSYWTSWFVTQSFTCFIL